MELDLKCYKSVPFKDIYQRKYAPYKYTYVKDCKICLFSKHTFLPVS